MNTDNLTLAFRVAVLIACGGGLTGAFGVPPVAALVSILAIALTCAVLDHLADPSGEGTETALRTRHGVPFARGMLGVVSFFCELAFIVAVAIWLVGHFWGITPGGG